MPVGPSHSRSRSGGGSSRASSSSRRVSAPRPSTRSVYSSRPMHRGAAMPPPPPPRYNSYGRRHVYNRAPRTYMFFGRPVVMSSGTRSGLGMVAVLFIIALIATIIMGVNLSNKTKTVQVYEADAKYYEQMISKAQAGEEGYYLATATFDERFNTYYNDDNPRTGAYEYVEVDGLAYYYIVFEYENEVTGETMVGETYTQFSSSQFNGLNGTIDVAYTYDDGSWVVMNTGYELENNQDYKVQLASKDNLKTMTTVFGVIAGVLVLVLIILIVRALKKSKKEQAAQDAKNAAEVAEAEAKAQVALETAENTNRVCAYCGAPVPDGDIRCPSCGSTEFTKK